MADNSITFEHPETHEVRVAPVGFCWLGLFLGFVVPIIRRDWKWAVLYWPLALTVVGFYYFPFRYNYHYIKDLTENGYRVKAIEHGDVAAMEKRLGFQLPLAANLEAQEMASMVPVRNKPKVRHI